MKRPVLAFLLCAALPSAEARIADRVVAVVSGKLVTLSDVQLEVAIALAERGAVVRGPDALDEPALKSGLDYAISQRLEAEEADKLRVFPIDDAELAAAMTTLAAKFENARVFDQFLAAFDADRPQLAAILERQLRAEKFLDSKIRLRAQVSEPDVKRYYAEHADERTRPYDQVRAALREKLIRDRYADLAAAEMQQIRRGADVRIVAQGALLEARP